VEKSEAILIRRHRLTESSLIVHWCGRGQGLFRTVAKGALRPSSPFRGRLDLFFSAEVGFVRARRGDLHLLTDVAVGKTRRGLARGYERVLTGGYLVQLIERVVEEGTPIDPLYELLGKALDHLEEAGASVRLVERFEWRVCEYLGIAEAGVAASQLLQAAEHRLPPGRGQLMARLGGETV